MNILNEMVRGASNQFGREFGRAGANSILKGANAYTVTSKNYHGRRSAKDSKVVKAIKDINKTEFVSTNKANVVRLIEITNDVIANITFEGFNSIRQLDDINMMLETYNDKFEMGSHLIADDYDDKSVEFLAQKRKELVDLMATFNESAKHFINSHQNHYEATRKKKKIATLLSIPLIGMFGVHRFYLGKVGQGIVYLLFCWTGISALISLFECISFLVMKEEKFDAIFNPEYAYFKQFQ